MTAVTPRSGKPDWVPEGWTGQWESWPGGTAGTGWGLEVRGGLEAAVKSPPSPRERRRPDVTWVRRRGRCVVQEALGSWEGTRNPPPAGRHHRGRPVCGAPAAPQTPWLEQGLCHWQSSQAASRGPQLPINLGDYKGFAVGVSAPLLREETWCLAQGHSSTCPPPAQPRDPKEAAQPPPMPAGHWAEEDPA